MFFQSLLLALLLQGPALHSPLPADLPDTSGWAYHLSSDDVGVYEATIPQIADAGALATMRAYLNRNGVCTQDEQVCQITVTFSYRSMVTDLEEQSQSVGQFAYQGPVGTHQGAGYIDIRDDSARVFRMFVLTDGEWSELQRDADEYANEQRSYMTFLRWGDHKRQSNPVRQF